MRQNMKLETCIPILVMSMAAAGCGKEDAEKVSGSSSKEAMSLEDKKNSGADGTGAVSSAQKLRAALAGQWRATITLEGDWLETQIVPLEFRIGASDEEPSVILNGALELPISSVSLDRGELTISFDLYQTQIVAQVSNENTPVFEGTWSIPWAGGDMEFPISATR
ncbi:MAG: hypothetical protein GY811_14880, partial [Myxococcales bacterium]|nr:hypothetical protein [Myxococcales bacterium]